MSYTDDELLDALRAFADEEDRPPTAAEANERDGLPSVTTFIYRFGSWNAAVEAAGLDARNRRRSDAELLADLRRFADARGEYPSYSAVEKADCEWMATPRTYENRFGTWNAALAAAGLATVAANGEVTDP